MTALPPSLRLGLLIAVAVVLLDQASKLWILEGLRLQDVGRIELSAVFDLSFVRNRGVSFGLFQADQLWSRALLILISAAIAGFFLYWLRQAERGLTVLSLGLVIGGALGNLIDRARFGFVVDFLDFSGLYFPWVFNVADAAITVGAALLMLDFLRSGELLGGPAKG